MSKKKKRKEKTWRNFFIPFDVVFMGNVTVDVVAVRVVWLWCG